MLVELSAVNEKHTLSPFEAANLTPEPIAEAIQKLLNDPHTTEADKANFADTPIRAAKAWNDLGQRVADSLRNLEASGLLTPKSAIYALVKSILATGFPMDSSDTGLVTQGPILVDSLCPHHLLPVTYEAFVSYRPIANGHVLGLSKLARLALALAARPVLQEQLTADIADVLFYDTVADVSRTALPQILSGGSAAHLIGKHSCMSCRGVKSNALTVTTAVRGCFHKESFRNEFYSAMTSIRDSQAANNL